MPKHGSCKLKSEYEDLKLFAYLQIDSETYEVGWNRVLSIKNGFQIIRDTELHHLGRSVCNI